MTLPKKAHGQATGKLYHLRLRVECTLFCNFQSQQTHAVLVIGLDESVSTNQPIVSESNNTSQESLEEHFLQG
jgi:hypothetical protein